MYLLVRNQAIKYSGLRDLVTICFCSKLSFLFSKPQNMKNKLKDDFNSGCQAVELLLKPRLSWSTNGKMVVPPGPGSV